MEGETVTVSSRWRMLLDVSPPRLGRVYVYGELMFEDQQDYSFTANLVSQRVLSIGVVPEHSAVLMSYKLRQKLLCVTTLPILINILLP